MAYGASRITVSREPTRTVISRHWYTPLTWLVLFFGAASAPGGVAVAVLWSKGAVDDNLLALFGCFGLLGAYLLYAGLASFVNASSLVISHDRVQVTHGPLPSWLARPTVPRDRIDCVVVTKRLWPGPSKPALLLLRRSSQREVKMDTYSVAARRQGHPDRPLLTGLTEPDAEAVGRALAAELGVECHKPRE